MSMMNKKTIEDIDLQGKTVLVRVDFNVPLDEEQNITDQTRIVGAMPTIEYLVSQNCKVVLCSHLGRPKGFDAKCSLAPVAQRLGELMGRKVTLAKDVIGEDAQACVAAMKPGEIVLLENVRFHKEEEKNDPEFAKALASFAQVYVNDAFGTAHRAHASTEGVAHILPAVAGYLIGKELAVLGKALESPERPFIAILGGKKVSDKIGVINNLLEKVDVLLIGGGMSYTFQKALGGSVGKSLLEVDKIDLATELMAKAKEKGVRLLLPIDTVIADDFSNTANRQTVDASAIPDGWDGLDIGPKTIALFSQEIKNGKTVIWNGPMGVFEFPNFAVGTQAIAQALADSDAISIIGGGDSAAAVEQMGFADRISHISTGGGASLEFMEGLELPGVAALNDR